VTNSRISDTGSVSNTIQYEDIGVILRVTPRINEDGFVRLEVSPEISTLSDSTVQISEGLNAIVVNSRSAKTTVNVQDGHTIVIGGLITTIDNNVEEKVPFLGDIPGLGLLFKTTRKVKERTELLIILTPHVLSNIPASDAETQRQFDGLEQIDEMGSDDLLKQRAMDPILHSRTMRARAGKKETEEDLETNTEADPVSLDRVAPSEGSWK
jgi:general secretion pathway protein D